MILLSLKTHSSHVLGLLLLRCEIRVALDAEAMRCVDHATTTCNRAEAAEPDT